MEWDIETKTYNTLFRFYSPEYGRWWSPDPVVQPWQSNYSAMDGNPVYYTDRFGLKTGGGEGGGGAKTETYNGVEMLPEVTVTGTGPTNIPKTDATKTYTPLKNMSLIQMNKMISNTQKNVVAENLKEFNRRQWANAWYGTNYSPSKGSESGIQGDEMVNDDNKQGGIGGIKGKVTGSMDLTGTFGTLSPSASGISKGNLIMTPTAEMIIHYSEKISNAIGGYADVSVELPTNTVKARMVDLKERANKNSPPPDSIEVEQTWIIGRDTLTHLVKLPNL